MSNTATHHSQEQTVEEEKPTIQFSHKDLIAFFPLLLPPLESDECHLSANGKRLIADNKYIVIKCMNWSFGYVTCKDHFSQQSCIPYLP